MFGAVAVAIGLAVAVAGAGESRRSPPTAAQAAAPKRPVAAVDEGRCRVAYRRDLAPCRKLAGEANEECANNAYVALNRCLDRF